MVSKKIVAFLQLFNEYEKGNLIRCLENCKQWASEIFIYDDASTDGSMNIYLDYTDRDHIIVGKTNEFSKELYHKNQLLELTLKSNPDFIGWLDGDDIFDRQLTESMQEFLEKIPSNVDGIQLHNLNLWRSDRYYRVDNYFNDLDKINIWRNNGNLHYKSTDGLHQPQHPQGITQIACYNNQLIHYGFSTEGAIARKYLDYKAQGQSGWNLERLIDERTSFYVVPAPEEWFPHINLPTDVDPPTPISYEQYRHFNSWDEYLKYGNH